jgi:hypothetical protein
MEKMATQFPSYARGDTMDEALVREARVVEECKRSGKKFVGGYSVVFVVIVGDGLIGRL